MDRLTLCLHSPNFQATLFPAIGPTLLAIVEGKRRHTLESLSYNGLDLLMFGRSFPPPRIVLGLECFCFREPSPILCVRSAPAATAIWWRMVTRASFR
jgi:hypothetical protein